MKLNHLLILRISPIVFLLGHNCLADDGIGKVSSLKGEAWILRASSSHHSSEVLHSNDVLRSGDEISTGKETRLKVIFGSDVASLIKADSRVKVFRINQKDFLLELNAGSIHSAVKNPLNRKDHFSIRTRTATMGVRGTKFYVKTDSDHDFLCTCSGKIEVKSKDGKSTAFVRGENHNAPKVIEPGSGLIEVRLKPGVAPADHAPEDAKELSELFETLPTK